uniref:Uncharacterized protein n=1 Tax=Tetranychus urticae TaxID=32264 RepID=T1KMN4_TETUR
MEQKIKRIKTSKEHHASSTTPWKPLFFMGVVNSQQTFHIDQTSFNQGIAFALRCYQL